MRVFYFRCVAVFLFLVTMLSLACTLPGCANLRENSSAYTLYAQVAVMKTIENSSAIEREKRIEAIIRATDIVERHASGEAITLATLVDVVIQSIPADIPASDRLLYTALAQSLAGMLKRDIGEGILDGGDVVKISEFMQALRDAAILARPR